jgi:hypothetical protein
MQPKQPSCRNAVFAWFCCAGLFALAVAARADEHTARWEYKVLSPSALEQLGRGENALASGLEKLGDEGWELVAIEPGTGTPALPGRYLFKRPRPAQPAGVAAGSHDSAPVEIKVVGAYDLAIGEPIRRPIPLEDRVVIARLKTRDQVRQYLRSLPNSLLIDRERHIQYRFLDDGSLWDWFDGAVVRRSVEPARQIGEAQVQNLPAMELTSEQEEEIAGRMATGWRPLPAGKDPGCAKCAGTGVCSYCLGSGEPSTAVK